jgi:wyosine [tRNA(Phe)-imidazoG37] synthetase (radical SAM superfamily)
LGIDPLDFKTCSLDCVYCELGLTTRLTGRRGRWRDYRQILTQVKNCLSQMKRIPDSLTVSGSGEPTLHLDLGALLEGLGQLSPARRTVITNSTLLHLPQVRRDLGKADLLMPSLDALSPPVFAALNRPAPDLNPQKMLRGLMDLRQEFSGPIWLEILLVAGINDQEEELDKLRRAAADLRPDLVQLNTIVRPPALAAYAPVSAPRLAALAAGFDPPAVVISPPQAPNSPREEAGNEAEDVIIRTVRMRPCTGRDLLNVTGLNRILLQSSLRRLLAQGAIEIQDYAGRRYYRGKI